MLQCLECYLFLISVSAFVCFYTMPDRTELLTSASSIQNFHQGVTSQCTVNAKKLYTLALLDHANSE